jgi:hypothetical protein
MNTPSFNSTADTRLPNQNPGVYKILCSCGKVHMCQTGCHISARITERVRHTRMKNHRWASAEHSRALLTLIKQKSDPTSAVTAPVIREAIETPKHPSNFNREDGCRPSKAWRHLPSPYSAVPDRRVTHLSTHAKPSSPPLSPQAPKDLHSPILSLLHRALWSSTTSSVV